MWHGVNMAHLHLIDPSGLDEEWARGVAPLIRNRPATVVAPLLGFAWAALLHPAPQLLHLRGEPGSGKTELARIAIDFVGDEAVGSHRMTDGTPNSWGSTSKGIRNAIAAADLGVFVVDNVNELFNPRPGARRMAEIAGHVRATEIHTDPRIPATIRRCSVITTSPEPVAGEDVVRQLNVTDAGMFTLDDRFLRGRAKIARGVLGQELRATAHQLPPPPAEIVEGNFPDRGLAFCAWGLDLMGELLRRRSAVDVDEFFAWGRAALPRMAPAAAPQRSRRQTPNPELVGELQRVLIDDIRHGRATLEEDVPGEVVGRRADDRIYIVPAAAIRLLERRGSSPTARAMTAALASAELLVSGADGASTVPKRVHGRMVRVWDLPASFLEDGGYRFG